jgi:hypothetical protein
MERTCRSHHITLWRSLKASQPPESQGSAMAPATPSLGPSSLYSPATKLERHFSKRNGCTRDREITLPRSEMSLLAPAELERKGYSPAFKNPGKASPLLFHFGVRSAGALRPSINR